MSEIRAVKKEKLNEFIENFYNNSKQWYNKQMNEDFEFDERTQLAIIEKYSYSNDGNLILQYIKNPTKNVCSEAVKCNGRSIQFINNPTENMCLNALKE